MNIGIYGGSFNPPHYGHHLLVQQVLRERLVDKVFYVPTWRNPLKPETHYASGFHRIAMLALMTQRTPEAIVSDYDLKNEITESYQTVMWFFNTFPKDRLFFLMGSDAFENIKLWTNWEWLVKKATPIVIARPDENHHELKRKHYNHLMDIHPDVIRLISRHPKEFIKANTSSTEIRRKIAEGKRSWKYHCPKSIVNYIVKHNLYKGDMSQESFYTC